MKNQTAMEVQQKGAPGRRWLAYVLQFFLLLLAVFLGFLAEHSWASSIETEKENLLTDSLKKQSLAAVYTDLQQDSFNIERAIRANEAVSRGTDSLLNMIYSLSYPDSVVKSMYYLFRRYQYPLQPINFSRPANKIITGRTAVFPNGWLSDSLEEYDKSVRSVTVEYDRCQTAQQAARNDAFGIFDSEFLYPYNENSAPEILNSTQRFVFLSDEPKALNVYAGKLLFSRNSLQAYTAALDRHLEKCTDLIRLVKNERQPPATEQ
jgi:hypothetical protein